MERVKKKAIESGKTITEIVENALRKETAGEVPERLRENFARVLTWRIRIPFIT
ncbi:MAG: hypothetical protein JSV89_20565 [Spirochaetaceae bacterium]|nr:MAG: hypothetical protein JSV89_20565 [Spirochaetaceae bacterium]